MLASWLTLHGTGLWVTLGLIAAALAFRWIVTHVTVSIERFCRDCGAPLDGRMRVHHHTIDGKDVTR